MAIDIRQNRSEVSMCSFLKAHARLPISQNYSANNFVACSAISMATATKRWVTEMFNYFATLLAAVLFDTSCISVVVVRTWDTVKVSTRVIPRARVFHLLRGMNAASPARLPSYQTHRFFSCLSFSK